LGFDPARRASRVVTHLLVTNDFPPKVGGIQSYLWELWRRLPAGRASVLTTTHPDAAVFDAAQPFPVQRVAPTLWPTPRLAEIIRAAAHEAGAALIVFDPALPVGALARRVDLPYAVVVHGAEVALPARLPGSATVLRHILRGARLVVAAGPYVAREARLLAPLVPIVDVPPGVDVARFRPSTADERRATRVRLGLPVQAKVVLHLSRLVPRKGADTLIRAAARLAGRHPSLVVLIAGAGRDEHRLAAMARRLRAPVRFLGRVAEDDKLALYGAADVLAHVCRSRWGGLEQEGFGIIFLEAAACEVPQIAGASGGAADAVVDGETGIVVDPPTDVGAVSAALDRLLTQPDTRRAWGHAGRERAETRFSYDLLARQLDAALVAGETQ